MPAERLSIGPARAGAGAASPGRGRRAPRPRSGRRRQDDGELVPAAPVREVGGTDAPDNGVRDRDEQCVARDLAELGVGLRSRRRRARRRRACAVAVCSRDLERQRLVEHLPVAEPGQAVVVEAAQHGCPSACALDRGPVWPAIASSVWNSVPATGGSSERPNTVRKPIRRPPSSSGTATADRRPASGPRPCWVVVGDPDRADVPSVRRPGDRIGRRWVESRGGRMLRPVHLDVNDGAAHPGERQRSLDAAREDLVRVECLPERLDDAGSGGVLLRLRDSSRELAGEQVDLLCASRSGHVGRTISEALRERTPITTTTVAMTSASVARTRATTRRRLSCRWRPNRAWRVWRQPGRCPHALREMPRRRVAAAPRSRPTTR